MGYGCRSISAFLEPRKHHCILANRNARDRMDAKGQVGRFPALAVLRTGTEDSCDPVGSTNLYQFPLPVASHQSASSPLHHLGCCSLGGPSMTCPLVVGPTIPATYSPLGHLSEFCGFKSCVGVLRSLFCCGCRISAGRSHLSSCP